MLHFGFIFTFQRHNYPIKSDKPKDQYQLVFVYTIPRKQIYSRFSSFPFMADLYFATSSSNALTLFGSPFGVGPSNGPPAAGNAVASFNDFSKSRIFPCSLSFNVVKLAIMSFCATFHHQHGSCFGTVRDRWNRTLTFGMDPRLFFESLE